ncbi:hypothetical protein CB1_000372013 [Camelus ferus]|nr:hypothetical protein CB1_000372013 [Camelus ferus]
MLSDHRTGRSIVHGRLELGGTCDRQKEGPVNTAICFTIRSTPGPTHPPTASRYDNRIFSTCHQAPRPPAPRSNRLPSAPPRPPDFALGSRPFSLHFGLQAASASPLGEELCRVTRASFPPHDVGHKQDTVHALPPEALRVARGTRTEQNMAPGRLQTVGPLPSEL